MAESNIPKSLIGSIGQLPFVCSSDKVLTFNNLTKENSIRWAQHDVIGKKPVWEFIGYDLSSVSFSIRFDVALGVLPEKGLQRLKKMMENRQYKTLIIGKEYLGRYIIEGISETRKYHDKYGTCLVAEATLKLREWSK